MTQNIIVHKITRSSIDRLDFDPPDFDSITTALPSGLYTTFRTYAERTKVIGLHSHLDRLYIPAKAQGIVPAIRKPADFRETLANLLSRFNAPETRVRLILDASSEEQGTIYVLLQPLQLLPPEIYRNGVRLELSRSSREKPSLKQTAFIGESASDRKRIGGEIFEILLTDKGRILEGMTSNFFYIRDGALCTAGRSVLIGVTRQTILRIAKEHGITTCFKAIKVNDLSFVEEAFITSSSRGIVPVVQIEANQIANGRAGELTKKLMKLYEENVLSLAEELI